MFRKILSVFKIALNFIRENPSLIFSLALIVIMPSLLYFNTYLTLRAFEKTVETELLRKATMVENILNVSLRQINLKNQEEIQTLINEIKIKEDEIINIEILVPQNETHEKYSVIASFQRERIGTEIAEDFFKSLAWNQPEGTSHREIINSQRVLAVDKIILGDKGEKLGIVSISLSLQKTDKLIAGAFSRSYLILGASIAIILVLTLNHARLFGYAVRLAKLQEIDEMKDNFISMASHELRAPLTAMRGYLSFLEEKKEELSKENKKFISRLKLSVNRLENLVEDILEVSRLEQNRVPINLQLVNPASLIKECVLEMSPKAKEKNLELTYLESNEPLPLIKIDPERFKQALINLISNAIKYTLKGKIEITTKKRRFKFLDITIADTGIGISAENQKNLFQKFYRIQNKETSEVTGTGLGLWITRDLVQKMKGEIFVESIEGIGSHFTISFPIHKK